jgi:acyl-CoA thioester hydrolase
MENLIFKTQVRVRYAEVDQSGFVYNGNYSQYYEVGRTEALRSMGTTYKKMEDEGIVMPLINQYFRYYKPAIYDDLLTITTQITNIPEARIRFEYEIHNEAGILLNSGYNELIFLNKAAQRPQRAPEWFVKLLKSYRAKN